MLSRVFALLDSGADIQEILGCNLGVLHLNTNTQIQIIIVLLHFKFVEKLINIHCKVPPVFFMLILSRFITNKTF